MAEGDQFKPNFRIGVGAIAPNTWDGTWGCDGCQQRFSHTRSFYYFAGKTYCGADCVGLAAAAPTGSARDKALYVALFNVRENLREQAVAKGFDHTQTALWQLTEALIDYTKAGN